MTLKKHKNIEQELLEKELFHSRKYGHKVQTSKKSYKRSKLKQELQELIENDAGRIDDGAA